MGPLAQDAPDNEEGGGPAAVSKFKPPRTSHGTVTLPDAQKFYRPEPGSFISSLSEHFDYDPDCRNVRLVKSGDGVLLLQVRKEMGLREMFPEGRPDTGKAPLLREFLERKCLADKEHREFKLTRPEFESLITEVYLYYSRAFVHNHLGNHKNTLHDCSHAIRALEFLDECNLGNPAIKGLDADVSLPKMWMLHTYAQVQLTRDQASQGEAEARECAEWVQIVVNHGIETIQELAASPWSSFEEKSRTEALKFLNDLKAEVSVNPTGNALIPFSTRPPRISAFPESFRISSKIGPEFDYVDGKVTARIVKEGDKEALQIRVAYGVDEIETTGRPDGKRPWGFDSVAIALSNRYQREYRSWQASGWGRFEFTLTYNELEALEKEANQYTYRAEVYADAANPEVMNHYRSFSDFKHVVDLYRIALTHAPSSSDKKRFENLLDLRLLDQHRQEIYIAREEGKGNLGKALEKLADTLDQAVLYCRKTGQNPYDFDKFQQLERVTEGFLQRFCHKNPQDQRFVYEMKLREALRFDNFEEAARYRDKLASLALRGSILGPHYLSAA